MSLSLMTHGRRSCRYPLLPATNGHKAEHFEQALRLDPDYAQAHNNLGALLYLAGRREEAADHFRRTIALRPDNIEARTNLAALPADSGRPASARCCGRE